MLSFITSGPDVPAAELLVAAAVPECQLSQLIKSSTNSDAMS